MLSIREQGSLLMTAAKEGGQARHGPDVDAGCQGRLVKEYYARVEHHGEQSAQVGNSVDIIERNRAEGRRFVNRGEHDILAVELQAPLLDYHVGKQVEAALVERRRPAAKTLVKRFDYLTVSCHYALITLMELKVLWRRVGFKGDDADIRDTSGRRAAPARANR